MRIAVVGGKLQGVEAVYLAHKAGWEVFLIDFNPGVPASGMCDFFIPMDIVDKGWLDPVLKDVEMIIPATEEREVLDALSVGCREVGIPFAFDPRAYAISSSKLESDRLFGRIGVPAPVGWPGCGFPVVAKPSGGSGSEGVRVIYDRGRLEERFMLPPDGWVLQEYMEGPSYSLEVVGVPGDYRALQVTDLEMDAGYDCKRVTAPSVLTPGQVTEFEKISLQIAEAVQLRGLMDVEVILHKGQLKVLEIDARLPSQTPTVVYQSTGINMLQMLAECFFDNETFFGEEAFFIGSPRRGAPGRRRQGVVYEHIKVTPGVLEVCGEHILAGAGPVRLHTDFYGADEAITNYAPGRREWVATLIVTGAGRKEAREKRDRVINDIRAHFKLDVYRDPFPGDFGTTKDTKDTKG